MFHRCRTVLLACAILALAIRCVPETTPASDTWPAVSGTALYVSAGSGSDAGDGTKQHPYLHISVAVAKASTGTTIALDDGIYVESVVLPAGVSLVGGGSGRAGLQPNGGIGIRVTGTGTSRIDGLTVLNAKGFGIRIETASATLHDVTVDGTVADGTDKPGHGVALQQSGPVTIDSCTINGSAGTGIIAWGSGAVSIIDPLFTVSPVSTVNIGNKIGIIDPLFLPRSNITNNAAGGVAIIDPLFGPATSSLTVSHSNISANGRYGVAVYGGSLSVQSSAISGTTGSAMADGIVIAGGAVQAPSPPSVSIDKSSMVTGNGRTGLLVVGPASVEVAGEFSLNGRGGVWAEHALASVHLNADAHVARNKMVGVAVSGGASLAVDGATIRETQGFDFTPSGTSVPVSLADGIGVYTGSHGRISGAQIIDNPRAAVLGRDCAITTGGMADLLVSGCTISGSKYGVVVHGATSAMAAGGQDPAAPANNYDAVGKAADDSDLPAETSICSDATTPCNGVNAP